MVQQRARGNQPATRLPGRGTPRFVHSLWTPPHLRGLPSALRPLAPLQPRVAISRATLRSILARRLDRRRLRAGLDELITGPIRGELLGAEHLAERARAVAKAQRLAAAAERDHNVGPAGFRLEYGYGEAVYDLVVERPHEARAGAQEVVLDGRHWGASGSISWTTALATPSWSDRGQRDEPG